MDGFDVDDELCQRPPVSPQRVVVAQPSGDGALRACQARGLTPLPAVAWASRLAIGGVGD
jgi:hypothetical protein